MRDHRDTGEEGRAFGTVAVAVGLALLSHADVNIDWGIQREEMFTVSLNMQNFPHKLQFATPQKTGSPDYLLQVIEVQSCSRGTLNLHLNVQSSMDILLD